MKPRSSLGFSVVVVALVVAGGAGLARQWRQTMALRGELEVVRADAGELERLRLENQRLRGRQISAGELAVLRADHAALPRLRAEMDVLAQQAAKANH